MTHLLGKTPEALLEELNAEDELQPWELAFARYLSAHPYLRLKKQSEVASRLAGTDISPSQLRATKYKPLWQDTWLQLRAEQEDYKRRAEERIKKCMPRAARLAEKMLKAVEGELERGDAMGAVRAGTPLVGEYLARALPKRLEGAAAQQAVIINLSPAQLQSLNAKPLEVSAQEIVVEPEGEK